MIAPIQYGLNEPGRRHIPLPGGHSLTTRGDAGELVIQRFDDAEVRDVKFPIVVSPEVADLFERMAEEIHADLALRFEAVISSVYHLLDYPGDIGAVLDNVHQALDFVDDPRAASANLANLKKRNRA